MTFEKEYNHLFKVAKQKSHLYKIDIDPSEIVSDIYLKLFSDPSYKYSAESFEKEIFNYCVNYKNNKEGFVQLGVKDSKDFGFKLDCTCSMCKEVKPAMCFPIITFKNGYKFQQIRCSDCITIANRKNFQNYFSKNKDEWNLYIKERYKKASEELTDAYIKKLLRQNYSREHIAKNPHLVKIKRLQIIEKRKNKSIH